MDHVARCAAPGRHHLLLCNPLPDRLVRSAQCAASCNMPYNLMQHALQPDATCHATYTQRYGCGRTLRRVAQSGAQYSAEAVATVDQPRLAVASPSCITQRQDTRIGPRCAVLAAVDSASQAQLDSTHARRVLTVRCSTLVYAPAGRFDTCVRRHRRTARQRGICR